ncbi:MAG: CCA tRNA nucleotidyltransferase [Patescibacteria group bacterium]
MPKNVEFVLNQLKAGGFEAYIVGGSVRDILMDKEPKDWDVTTNATPQEIQKAFINSFYNNVFGTVGVVVEGDTVEVTTYRSETSYSDKRHPDKITFSKTLDEDLRRRDFTVNAMAYDGNSIIDNYSGKKDLEKKIIRAVGDPNERFNEDALRMLRAIRFSAQLDFYIEEQTWRAIIKLKKNIIHVSGERIRDELIKIIDSDDALRGMWLLKESGLQKIILPELESGVGVKQNKHHPYTVYFHNLLTMQYCPSENYLVKLAALFHDIAKPETKQGDDINATFYNHEHMGVKTTRQIMKRLKFSAEEISKVVHLVKNHMFYYNIGEITDAGVRRLIRRVGNDNIQDLLDIRIGDRLGSGCAKAKPYKLEELERRIIKVQKDPIDTRMLKINGHILCEQYGMEEGAKVGVIMHLLLEEVLDDPNLNTEEYLHQKAQELIKEHEKMSEEQARAVMKKNREFLQDYNDKNN